MNDSTIGIRSEWHCVVCGHMERQHQLAAAAEPVLEVPSGWKVLNGRTYCPGHIPCRIESEALARQLATR